MKRTFLTLLAFTLLLAGASAQKTEGLDHTDLMLSDSTRIDSIYHHWNDFVSRHPKDEQAWRNLFDASENKVFRLLSKNKHWQAPLELRRQMNVVRRMAEAIPGTYTFYYCAYEGGLTSEEVEKQMAEHGIPALFHHDDKYADSAIATMPDDASAYDYERWIQYLIPKRDTLRLAGLLARYYESGQYPEEILQYHFNELQGMDEGGVYIGAHEGDIIGKLILQEVLGLHKDKILYDENAVMVREYAEDVFARIGIPFDDEVWQSLHSARQQQMLTAIMCYIFDKSKRPVYLSAHNMWGLILGEGLPDELKAKFYNEGLTMRYSASPYDNLSAKRRNTEERYRLEYLRQPFHPQQKSQQRFAGSVEGYAMDYVYLLHDLLPYYKQHNRTRYQWLQNTLADIICQLERKNFDVEDLKGYLK